MFFQDVLVEYFQPFGTGIKTVDDFLDGVFWYFLGENRQIPCSQQATAFTFLRVTPRNSRQL
jgi:hypothetical protein